VAKDSICSSSIIKVKNIKMEKNKDHVEKDNKLVFYYYIYRHNNMQLDLLKAIKSTHRSPISRVLHFVGISLYIVGFILIVDYYLGSNRVNSSSSSPLYGIILFPIAIGLFLTGHKIEGNLKAMTLIIILKYLRSKLRLRQ
jgi:hypothetical protein